MKYLQKPTLKQKGLTRNIFYRVTDMLKDKINWGYFIIILSAFLATAIFQFRPIFVIILLILIGYIFIASLVKYFHRKAGTGEFPIEQKFHEFLKVFAGFLELIVYIFLFTFNQFTLLAGLLIIKGIWHYPGVSSEMKKSDEVKGLKTDTQKIQEGGAAGAIFRIGVILILSFAFIISFLIKNYYDNCL